MSEKEETEKEEEQHYRSVMSIGQGSSCGVVIPKAICNRLGIRGGNYVRVSMRENAKQIVIEKVE